MTRRDEVLLWLNDRCGSTVFAEVTVNVGDVTHLTLIAEGGLRHWHERAVARGYSPPPHDDSAGRYVIGSDDELDLSDLPAEATVWLNPRSLTVELARGVCLLVAEVPSDSKD